MEPELSSYIHKGSQLPSGEGPSCTLPSGTEKAPDWDSKLEAYLNRDKL